MGGSADAGETNITDDTYVNYLFAEVAGFSKFGSYTGNASNDGPFIYTGFKPAFVLIKKTSATGNWRMKDNARDPYNVVNNQIAANTTAAEEVDQATEAVDFLSNGFKLRTSDSGTNSGTFVYAALPYGS